MGDTKKVIALGTFDGVHLGHRALIETAIDMGHAYGMPAEIYTFKTHPMELFGRAPGLIMTDRERLEFLSGFGCSVTAEDFTNSYAALSAEEFVRMLQKKYRMGVAVAGFNYSFGAGGRGDVKLLKQLGRDLGFEVCEISPAYYRGEVISSTRIRASLSSGDIDSANAMLGREYSLSGPVVENRGIGRSIGFPTANIDAGKRLLPYTGVYASYAAAQGSVYKAVTNIGTNPTVGGDHVTVETHLLDFSGDLYGRTVKVSFIKRLRGDIKFSGTGELSAQISADIAAAREFLS